jgi:hypothetical protein
MRPYLPLRGFFSHPVGRERNAGEEVTVTIRAEMVVVAWTVGLTGVQNKVKANERDIQVPLGEMGHDPSYHTALEMPADSTHDAQGRTATSRPQGILGAHEGIAPMTPASHLHHLWLLRAGPRPVESRY